MLFVFPLRSVGDERTEWFRQCGSSRQDCTLLHFENQWHILSPCFPFFSLLVWGGRDGENRRFPQWKVTVQNNRFSSNFKHLPQSVMSGNVEISCSICLQVWNFTHTGVCGSSTNNSGFQSYFVNPYQNAHFSIRSWYSAVRLLSELWWQIVTSVCPNLFSPILFHHCRHRELWPTAKIFCVQSQPVIHSIIIHPGKVTWKAAGSQ